MRNIKLVKEVNRNSNISYKAWRCYVFLMDYKSTYKIKWDFIVIAALGCLNKYLHAKVEFICNMGGIPVINKG